MFQLKFTPLRRKMFCVIWFFLWVIKRIMHFPLNVVTMPLPVESDVQNPSSQIIMSILFCVLRHSVTGGSCDNTSNHSSSSGISSFSQCEEVKTGIIIMMSVCVTVILYSSHWLKFRRHKLLKFWNGNASLGWVRQREQVNGTFTYC